MACAETASVSRSQCPEMCYSCTLGDVSHHKQVFRTYMWVEEPQLTLPSLKKSPVVICMQA